jgi:hypothetical protein
MVVLVAGVAEIIGPDAPAWDDEEVAAALAGDALRLKANSRGSGALDHVKHHAAHRLTIG